MDADGICVPFLGTSPGRTDVVGILVPEGTQLAAGLYVPVGTLLGAMLGLKLAVRTTLLPTATDPSSGTIDLRVRPSKSAGIIDLLLGFLLAGVRHSRRNGSQDILRVPG